MQTLYRSLRFARKEYGKFRKLFLQTATGLGFDGATKNTISTK